MTKSPQPIARLNLAILTASSAFLAPDVFGSKVTPFGIKSKIFSLSFVFARRSASAAEIFAGAVQDYGKGKIIGTQTFGKGIVQTIQPLTDGSAIKYTIAQYYTPKGQVIQGNGVTPDMVVELPKDATEDLQLDAALEYVKGELR